MEVKDVLIPFGIALTLDHVVISCPLLIAYPYPNFKKPFLFLLNDDFGSINPQKDNFYRRFNTNIQYGSTLFQYRGTFIEYGSTLIKCSSTLFECKHINIKCGNTFIECDSTFIQCNSTKIE